jgi:hypothetical protein
MERMRRRAPLAADAGSAVAEFVMVVSLLTVLTLSVMQLALALHIRNTVLDAAASSTVLRMCRASASCITDSVSTVSRDTTMTNSATAEPASAASGARRRIRSMAALEAGDAIDRLFENPAQGRAGQTPDDHDQSGGHQRDEHPARHVSFFLAPEAPEATFQH